VPTVVNGMVYCGTGGISTTDTTDGLGGIVAYGLLNSYLMSNFFFFSAPSNLTGRRPAPNQVRLQWTRNSTLETQFRVERSLNGINYSVLGYVPNGRSTYLDTGASNNTQYFYRVAAISGLSSTIYSNVAIVAPQAGGDGTPPRLPEPVGDVVTDGIVQMFDSSSSGFNGHTSIEELLGGVGGSSDGDASILLA
jgi:hypothetical protein